MITPALAPAPPGPIPATVRPFLRWAGSKRASVPRLIAALPYAKLDIYVEPFLGAGALLIALAQQSRFGSAIVSDSNPELMHAWRQVRSNLAAVLRAHAQWAETEDAYYAVRAFEPASPAERAARFLYLNRSSFNGLWRVNAASGMNVPFGKQFIPLDVENLTFVSRLLQRENVQILDAQDYADTINWVHANVLSGRPAGGDSFGADGLSGRAVLVYLDPPYFPIRGESFTGYTAESFGPAEHEKLSSDTDLLAKLGWHVMVSNADIPQVRALYNGWPMESALVGRPVSAKAPGRKPVSELLIRSWE